MNLPLTTAIALGSAAGTGVIALLFVGIYWKTVGGFIPETWPKLIVELVQGASAVVTIGCAFASTDDKPQWYPAALVGCISLLVWKILQVVIDSRIKAWERTAKDVWARIQEESELRTGLLTLFREFVLKKVRRLSRALSHQKRPKMGAILVPEAHLGEILVSIAVYFAGKHSEDQSTPNFRVGLYVSKDGYMQPLRALDLNHGDDAVFTSFTAHRERFSLNEPIDDNPAHVVKCVQTHSTIIVEDCQASANCGDFHYFNDNQKNYLRSMLAYHIGQVHMSDGTMTVAALVIDTDAPGFFREEDRESLKFALREFESRIKLELLLHALLPTGGNTI